MIWNIIATALLLTGIGLSYRQYTEILGKEIVVGRVTALEPHPGRRGGTIYTVVAQFSDGFRQTHIYRSGFVSSSL